jgi:hypothetical protein
MSDDMMLDRAREIIGVMWIPIVRERLELEQRIALALEDAEDWAGESEREQNWMLE